MRPEKSEFEYEHEHVDKENELADQRDILDSVIEKTNQVFSQQNLFEEFVDFVRKSRLPSKFSHENLAELVRFVLGRTNISSLPVDQEECVEWIASCLYDDPMSNVRSSELWTQIIEHIQAKG